MGAMSYRASWDGRLPARVELDDGTALTLRELHPDDEPALRIWFQTLSEVSRYQRFHNYVTDLSPAHWRYLTRIDGVDHVAIVALQDGEVVGVARMIRLDAPSRAAEIAFLVGDDLQRRGVGSLLRDVLLVIARARAYQTLYAYVLPDNLAIRRLLAIGADTIADRGHLIELRL
jgi:acetyltransferase